MSLHIALRVLLVIGLSSTAIAAPLSKLMGGGGAAASPPPAASAPVDDDAGMAQLNGRLAQVQEKLASLEADAAASDKEQRRFWLALSEYAYRQQLAAMSGLKAIKAQGGNPASQGELDNGQRDALSQLINQEIGLLAANLKLQDGYLETVHGELQRAQAELRQAQDALEKGVKQGAATAPLSAKVALAQLKVESWSATLASTDARQTFTRARLQARREQILALENAPATEGAPSTEDSVTQEEQQRLAQQAQHYAQEQSQQQAVEETLRANLLALHKQRDRLQADLDEARPNRKKALEESQAKERAALAQQEPWLQFQLESNAIHAGILSDLILANMLESNFLNKRVALRQGGQQSDLRQLNDQVLAWTSKLELMQQAMQMGAALALDQVDRLGKTAENPPELIKHWQEREKTYREAATDLRRSLQELKRGLNESDKGGQTLGMRADLWQENVRNTVVGIWNFELFSVNDSISVDGQNVSVSRGVTIGKMIVAVLLISVGFALCLWLGGVIERQFVKRTRKDPVSVRIMKRWILSVAFVILLINSLLLVKIPLAAFAFLGGAIAIGLGFGMQTLLKNLISGLMMLLERPFKPGDTIGVGGTLGTIVDMNVRAAVVRDVNGIDTLVPNSTFLEQNVTNWSYTSSSVRQGIKVGVAYGSDLRLVAKLLEEDVRGHGQISHDKEPEILLEDFGADSLVFGIYYWLDLSTGVLGRQVASDLRFMVESSLRKNGISIAFPQRDVHLDVMAPIRVQLEPASAAAPEAEPDAEPPAAKPKPAGA
jgi:small-conductance mechanosensitive channel